MPPLYRARAGMTGQGIAVEVRGLRELLRDLRAAQPAVHRDMRRELRDVAGEVAKDASHRAPRSTRPMQKGRKRRLADSLRPAVRGSAVYVRSPVPYGNIVHWGGRRPSDAHNRAKWINVPARPFIAQAAEANAERFLDEVGDAVERVLSRHGFH